MRTTELIVLIMNAGALVWGAAVVRTEVRHLSKGLDELKDQLRKAIESWSERSESHERRISTLEGRLTHDR